MIQMNKGKFQRTKKFKSKNLKNKKSSKKKKT